MTSIVEKPDVPVQDTLKDADGNEFEDSTPTQFRVYNMTWEEFFKVSGPNEKSHTIGVSKDAIHHLDLTPVKARAPAYIVGAYNVISSKAKINKMNILANAMIYGTSLLNHDIRRETRISKNAYNYLFDTNYTKWNEIFGRKFTIFPKGPLDNSEHTQVVIFVQTDWLLPGLSEQSKNLSMKISEISLIRLEYAFLRSGMLSSEIKDLMERDIQIFKLRVCDIVRACERAV